MTMDAAGDAVTIRSTDGRTFARASVIAPAVAVAGEGAAAAMDGG